MRIAFWNTNRNVEINSYIQDIIIEHRLDIIVLAEYKANADDLRDMLCMHGIYMNEYVSLGCDRITLLGCYEDVEPFLKLRRMRNVL